MPSFIVLLMRLLALAAGLVFAAGALLVAFVGATMWLLNGGWKRLGSVPWRTLIFPVRPQRSYVPQRVRVPVRDVTDVHPK
jgi:hypothetical protein